MVALSAYSVALENINIILKKETTDFTANIYFHCILSVVHSAYESFVSDNFNLTSFTSSGSFSHRICFIYISRFSAVGSASQVTRFSCDITAGLLTRYVRDKTSL